VINKEEVNLTDLKNSRFAFLDFEKLTFPLLLRKWKKGDRFHPYGMKGTKLLSDFFIDLKLNRFEKDNIWLLVSGGTIVWVAGHRIAGPFKINDKTKKVFSVKIL
jgi:tRNA(Ile)-lysidine synthase